MGDGDRMGDVYVILKVEVLGHLSYKNSYWVIAKLFMTSIVYIFCPCC